MKKNKIIVEEPDTDKHCSERKACKRKWLATLCLSLGRHECALRGTLCCYSTNGWARDINDSVTTTQVQVTVNIFQCCATVKQFQILKQ